MADGCYYCRKDEFPGTGKVLHFGGRFATVRNCPVCGDGERVADTLIPSVTTDQRGGTDGGD